MQSSCSPLFLFLKAFEKPVLLSIPLSLSLLLHTSVWMKLLKKNIITSQDHQCNQVVNTKKQAKDEHCLSKKKKCVVCYWM